jgi:hypothetical protein
MGLRGDDIEVKVAKHQPKLKPPAPKPKSPSTHIGLLDHDDMAFHGGPQLDPLTWLKLPAWGLILVRTQYGLGHLNRRKWESLDCINCFSSELLAKCYTSSFNCFDLALSLKRLAPLLGGCPRVLYPTNASAQPVRSTQTYSDEEMRFRVRQNITPTRIFSPMIA